MRDPQLSRHCGETGLAAPHPPDDLPEWRNSEPFFNTLIVPLKVMWCSGGHDQSSAHAPGHTGPTDGPGLKQKGSGIIRRQSSGKVPCTPMRCGSTSKVLKWLLHMTQVEFAQGAVKSIAKVQNLGKSWGTLCKHCKTSIAYATVLQNLTAGTHFHEMPHIRRQDCG